MTRVAELVLDVDPTELSEEELMLLRDRLPAWSLTLSAINRSVTALEASLRDDTP